MSDKPFVNDGRKSYCAIVPTKQPNKSGTTPAEVAEGREQAKENTQQPNPCQTQSRESGSSGLERVREAARKDKGIRFTALLHHVTEGQLYVSYLSLKPGAAAGVDGVTWEEYGQQDLKERLSDLHRRIHSGAYRAQPSRRVYIPKTDGRQRPLGIAALEDKIVQHAVGKILSQIWEEDFQDFSYGFRRGRSQHDALDALYVGIVRKKVNWVLDMDIRNFFDKLSHEVMIQLVERRVADQRIIRLIQKWLKAGVMEQGEWRETKEGTPQGAVISPILANIYLHYVLDDWVEAWRKRQAQGDVIIVRYADDAVLGFQHREEAEQFLEQLRERLTGFGLELHSDKTRLIEFGRFAAERREKRGQGKPETFDFLGFTHACGRTQRGAFKILRKTIGKRLQAKLKEIKATLRRRMHEAIEETLEYLQSVVRGYNQYFAVPDNLDRMGVFRTQVLRIWLRALRRRSQRSTWTWERFLQTLGCLLPEVQALHPYPDVRFDVKHSNIQGRNRVR